MRYWRDIFNEIIELKMEVDFNQGLEAALITDEAAEYLSKMKIPLIRVAYDRPEQRKTVKNAIDKLAKFGISKRKILVYSLFGFNETPDEYLERVIDMLTWGSVVYPMRYQPVNALKKDAYVSPKWTQKQLNMVASARRVIGFGGIFPPYEALIDKFKKAKNFDEAFELYPIKKEEDDYISQKIDKYLEYEYQAKDVPETRSKKKAE